MTYKYNLASHTVERLEAIENKALGVRPPPRSKLINGSISPRRQKTDGTVC